MVTLTRHTRSDCVIKKVAVAMTPEERWKQRMSLAVIVGYMLAGIVVAFATPDDILNYHWAQAFVEFIGGIVPSVAELMPTSPIHDVAQFYAAVMWVFAPIVVVATFAVMNDKKEIYTRMFGEKKLYSFFVCSIFVPLGAYILYAHADGSTRTEQVAMSSRFGLAFIYSMALTGMSVFFALMLIWIRKIPYVYFGKD